MENEWIYALDIFGTVIFAITGAVKGVRNRLDFLGVIVFAITVGCAGGMVRDCLIGATPVASFSNSLYLVSCIITGVLVFFLAPWVVGRWRIILFCDAIGLGVFTALGAQKALSLGIGPVGQIFAGVIGAVGGGVLRDVFSKEVPAVLTSDFYASASIIGAVIFVILEKCSIAPILNFFITMSFITILRLCAMHYHIHLPVARMVGEEKKK
ncbi:MAG: trimeric intracellular cation channel family protein [Spirochaetales bacterium]|uniref:trimeric intracellular cation channel family protein n=1 Tax=Bullifex sp. TaxID=2815808 RepID=UPI002A572C11|nr:trimeric intracellular cation channel family protein [Bullifex sp.]MDD5972116.1 trimeric intracellular cation channel family protein [Spirochaetales bacterium]MDD7271763.1 trimeric intracellular cation channel family protein [Spirochaetales bacterium]MDY4066727.1 trimeric intracellular cation channel family protein [Bullifex sp.]